ncbi:MAG TPA: serine hydrolase, partial [Niabella sp.]|nr:serine hydrolase [Niabella sp.]
MRTIFLISLVIITSSLLGQKADHKLEAAIKKEIAGFNGDIGIYVHHLRKNKTVTINADTVFPTASIVKVPILVGVFDKIARGELKLSQEFVYDTGRVYGGSGVMQVFRGRAKTELSTMISPLLHSTGNVPSHW